MIGEEGGDTLRSGFPEDTFPVRRVNVNGVVKDREGGAKTAMIHSSAWVAAGRKFR